MAVLPNANAASSVGVPVREPGTRRISQSSYARKGFEMAGAVTILFKEQERPAPRSVHQSSPAKRRFSHDETRSGTFGQATLGRQLKIAAGWRHYIDNRGGVFSWPRDWRYYVSNKATQYTCRGADYLSKRARVTRAAP